AKVQEFIGRALAYDEPTSAAAALAFALETGLRREELEHVRREDLTLTDTLADVLVVTDLPCHCMRCVRDGGRHRTKNRYARYVPLTKRAEAIARWQLERLERDAIPGKWLFPVLRRAPFMRVGAGDQLSPERLDRTMQVLSKAAGIALPPRTAVHFTRHVALSRWAGAGLTQDQRNLARGHHPAGWQGKY